MAPSFVDKYKMTNKFIFYRNIFLKDDK